MQHLYSSKAPSGCTAGTGTNFMPANPDVSWWNATLWQNDGLYKEIAFGASGLQYFLGHHTFNHENLNAITYYDTVQQIRLNQVRRQLWPCYSALRTTGD